MYKGQKVQTILHNTSYIKMRDNTKQTGMRGQARKRQDKRNWKAKKVETSARRVDTLGDCTAKIT
jgi:hypothetical protein